MLVKKTTKIAHFFWNLGNCYSLLQKQMTVRGGEEDDGGGGGDDGYQLLYQQSYYYPHSTLVW